MSDDDIKPPRPFLGRLFGRRSAHIPAQNRDWKTKSFSRRYEIDTPWGFKATYELRGYLTPAAGSKTEPPMLPTEEETCEIIDRWHAEIFSPVALKEACITFSFSKIQVKMLENLGLAPNLSMARFKTVDGATSIAFDNNACETVEVARTATSTAKWQHNGCTVRLSVLDRHTTKAQIQDNFTMLTAKQIEELPPQTWFSKAVETLAVTLMYYEQQAIEAIVEATRKQEIANPSLRVRTEGLGERQRITWEKLGATATDGQWVVFGFREEESFGDDPWSDVTSPSRSLVAHGYLQSQELVERLSLGATYCYTFLLKNTRTGEKAAWLRLTVVMPSQQETERLQEVSGRMDSLLERIRNHEKRATPENAGEKIVAALSSRGKTKEVVDEFFKDYRQKLRKKGYSEEEMDDMLATLRALSKRLMSDDK